MKCNLLQRHDQAMIKVKSIPVLRKGYVSTTSKEQAMLFCQSKTSHLAYGNSQPLDPLWLSLEITVTSFYMGGLVVVVYLFGFCCCFLISV